MGQMMIGMNNGVAAPQPWEIPCQPVQLFKDETRQLEIPNTTRIQVIRSKIYVGVTEFIFN